MAKTAAQRIKLTAEERAKAKAEWNSSQETITERPDGFHFKEEPSTPPDNLIVEEAPKARTEDQVIAPPINLSPDSLQLAALALGVTNSAVVVMFGQDCGLYDTEKKLLYPSLSRVINRMPASAASKASVFIDPLVLVFGLIVWANRIASIKSKQRTEANAITAREFAAASGVNWDVSRGERSAGPEVDTRNPPGEAGTGATGTVPQTGSDSVNANGVVGKIPDVIADLGNVDITGGG